MNRHSIRSEHSELSRKKKITGDQIMDVSPWLTQTLGNTPVKNKHKLYESCDSDEPVLL